MTVFPQHMAVDHSSHKGIEPLTVGWIVSVFNATDDTTLRHIQTGMPVCVYYDLSLNI